MGSSAALISIRPIYVERIISGEKRFEFRRSWAATPIDVLVIYATSPIKRIVSVAKVGRVIRASRTRLWEVARDGGPGVSRRELFSYLEGKEVGVALELVQTSEVDCAIDPRAVFGARFLPPQSFRYLKSEELERLKLHIGAHAWA